MLRMLRRNFLDFTKVKDIDRNSWFYKNCKRQRKNGAKICQECPFREYIEALESNK